MPAKRINHLTLIVFALLVFLSGPAAAAATDVLCEEGAERIEETCSEALIVVRPVRPRIASRRNQEFRVPTPTPSIPRRDALAVPRAPGNFLIPLRC